MIHSIADFPVQPANPLGEIVEDLRKLDPMNRPATQAEILSLVSKIDDFVSRSLAILDHLLECEASWRTFVFQGKTEYDVEIEKHVEESLKDWADRADGFLSSFDTLVSGGISAESVETFRSRVAEVRGMLTPDDEFFEGEELDDLAAQAITEHESGATVDFLVMGE
jgi:hypothetical protein